MVSKSASLCKSLMLASSLLAGGGLLHAAELEEIIVVTGRATGQSLQDIPGSVGVVSDRDLALIQHTHINESADRVPGVWVSRGNGQEHLTAIRSPVVTGPGSCGVFLVLEDGIPTRPSGFCNVNQLFEINTEQADALEIFRGPNSAVYGNNAVHGVMNVLTRPIGTNEQASLMMDVGPDDYRRAFVSYTDGDAIRVDFHGDHDGGFIDDAGYDQQKVTIKTRSRQGSFTNQSLLEASNLNQETAGYIEGLDAYKVDHLKNNNGNPEAFRDAKSMHGYSRFTFREGEVDEFSLAPYANTSRMEFLQHFIRGAPLEINGHESAGLMGRFNGLLSPSHVESLSNVTGFTVEAGRAFVDQFQEQPLQPPSANFPQGQHYDFDVMMYTAALFSEYEYAITSLDRAIVGFRYDHQFYDYESKIPAGNFGIYTRPASTDDEFGNWGVNIGLIHDWSSANHVYINAATGFRTPQVAELYRLEGGQPVDGVDSEKVDSIEIGSRGSIELLKGVLEYELAIFNMKKDNVIFKTASRQYIGTGETSHQGVEVQLHYQTASDYFIRLETTYAEHRYEDIDAQLQGSPAVDLEGLIIDTAPRYFGAIQAGRDWGNYLVEFEVREMGSYFLDPEHDWKYDGHHLANVRALWRMDDEWKFSMRLMNVFDTDYAERADVTVANVPRYFVGQPRSLYVSVEKTFN